MSGICGLWNLDGQPVEGSLLAALCATMAHRGPDGEGIWASGPVGMACQKLHVAPESIGEIQPLVHPSGLVLVFDGRLDNRDELLQDPRIRAELSASAADAAFAMAAYRAFGDEFARRLNGDFALALFEPARRRLVLARDAIGVRPLYYYRTHRLFLFASEIKALLAHPCVATRPNDNTLAGFLLGTTDQSAAAGATFFEGIHSVPPAHVLVLSADAFMTRRYWDFDPDRRTRFATYPEYAEAFRHHFDQAVRRRLRSAFPVAVSVSGGLDSSSILCVAETLRRCAPDDLPPLRGLSHTCADGGPADERAFLQDIERKYQIAIQKLPLCPTGFVEGSRKSMRYAEEPLLDLQANDSATFLRTARLSGARVVLTGHWGDQMLSGRAYLVDLFRRFAWGKVHAHLREFPRWMTDGDASYSYRRAFLRELLVSHIPGAAIPLLRKVRARLGRAYGVGHSFYTAKLRERVHREGGGRTDTDNPLNSSYSCALYDEARSRYHVRCMEWNNKVGSMHGMEIAFPFLDRDLLAFLMGIPGEVPSWEGVPRRLLREAMRGVLPDSIRERRWKADFTQLVNEGMHRDYPIVLDYLRPDCRSAAWGYVHPQKMCDEVALAGAHVHRSDDNRISGSLGNLVGLELWLRTFFEGGGYEIGQGAQ